MTKEEFYEVFKVPLKLEGMNKNWGLPNYAVIGINDKYFSVRVSLSAEILKQRLFYIVNNKVYSLNLLSKKFVDEYNSFIAIGDASQFKYVDKGKKGMILIPHSFLEDTGLNVLKYNELDNSIKSYEEIKDIIPKNNVLKTRTYDNKYETNEDFNKFIDKITAYLKILISKTSNDSKWDGHIENIQSQTKSKLSKIEVQTIIVLQEIENLKRIIDSKPTRSEINKIFILLEESILTLHILMLKDEYTRINGSNT